MTGETLGTLIRRRRLEQGWTQEQLAERISAEGEYVRQSEISRIESGRVGLPRYARLERIAAALGLSVGELLTSSTWAHRATPVRREQAHLRQNEATLPLMRDQSVG